MSNYVSSKYPDSELYADIEKYGEKSFHIEILEENEDIIYISRTESTMIRKNRDDKLMYNKMMGASGRRVFYESDIVFIRSLYEGKNMYITQAYEKYYSKKVSFRAFKKVWHGDTFKDIYYHVYTEENKKFHFSLGQSRKGEVNRSAVFSEKDVIDIRTRQKNGEDKKDVKKDYEHLGAPHGFNEIWRGKNWKHVIV